MTARRKKSLARNFPSGLSSDREARFWDQHDFADFWAETEGVKAHVARSFAERVRSAARKRMIALRLADWQINEAKRIAKQLSVPYQTLLRRWISQGIVSQRRRLKRVH